MIRNDLILNVKWVGMIGEWVSLNGYSLKISVI